jgi:hypothetical protein
MGRSDGGKDCDPGPGPEGDFGQKGPWLVLKLQTERESLIRDGRVFDQQDTVLDVVSFRKWAVGGNVIDCVSVICTSPGRGFRPRPAA